jgi:pyruvate-ferredoxin/flavodoxin oxidoreductase
VAQDGFLTTHTLENVQLPEDELLRAFVGDPRERLRDLFDPEHALMSGVVANQDSYMKGKIAQRAFYERIPDVLRAAFHEWGKLTGRFYGLVQPHRVEDAETVLVSMGSTADTADAVVDHLRAADRRVGSITVTSFRPFPAEELALLVRGVRAVGVVERTDEPAAADNPLTRELKSALADVAADGASIPRVTSASAGLGSRDVAAGDLVAMFNLLDDDEALRARRHVVLGIPHPDGLPKVDVVLRPAGAYSLRGHSIGGFGSITTNKLLATVVGDLFGLHVQAYPRYGSEKKGLPTTYYLTIAEERIRQHAELTRVEFVPLHDVAAFAQGSPLAGLADGGTVFVQSPLSDPAAIWAALPAEVRAEILRRDIRLVALDTAALAMKHAPRPEFEVRMQGIALVGVFLRLAPFAERAGLDREQLLAAVGERLNRFYGKRGRAVVEANLAVVTEAYDGVLDVTGALKAAPGTTPVSDGEPQTLAEMRQ